MSLLAAALLALAGCKPAAPTIAPVHPPLRVGIDLWAGYYPLVIADEKGFLRDEHVAIELSVPGDTHRMIADFAGRKHDLICVSLADVILSTRVTSDIRMVLNSDESAGGDVILGSHPLTDVSQVRGKRIGTALGGFGELFVRQFIERQGLRPDEVTLVNVDAANVPDLLKSGEIDIGHTWDPYTDAAKAAGFVPWFSSADTPGLICDGMMAHTAVIRERPAEVRGLVRGWFRALEWWRLHPEEGNALVEHRLKLPAGSVNVNGIRLLDRAENVRAFAREPEPGSLSRAVALYIEFFISRGMLSQRPAPDDLLDGEFVAE